MAAVDVVVPAYGAEPLLVRACEAVAASVGVEPRVLVYAYTGDDRDAIAELPGVEWLDSGGSLGYAAGGSVGAKAGTAPIVAVLNNVALVEPDALQNLVAALEGPATGLVAGRVLLLREPGTMNSAGNTMQNSRFSWLGDWGDPAGEHEMAFDPASASGALRVVRRRHWLRVGGCHGELFPYREDVELSLRVWQAGLRGHFVPEATVLHEYDFGRTPKKSRLLERGRWVNSLALYGKGTLLSLLPGPAIVEFGGWISAARNDSKRHNPGAATWVIHHRAQARACRSLVQGARSLGDSAVLPHLRRKIEPSPRAGLTVPVCANRLIGRLAASVGCNPKARGRCRVTVPGRAAA